MTCNVADHYPIFLFLKHVQTGSGCWLWTGARGPEGYGQFGHEPAHRAAFRFFVGSIADGQQVCHHCDNPSCVRPDHLFTGTGRDNMLDAARKKRMGGDHSGWRTSPDAMQARMHRPRTSPAELRVIRDLLAAGLSGAEIARRLGLHASTVSRIRTGTRRASKSGAAA